MANEPFGSDPAMDALLQENDPEPVFRSQDQPNAMNLLPFFDADPCGEFGEQRVCMRDRATINVVAVECWKALRIPQTPTKPAPQDLSLFPHMHIDIILEVLGHLHPIDLIHVARMNKAFRSLLHAPITAPIWRASFVGRPPLPTCPPEIPGRRWAKLLFGPRQCDECGAPNTSPDHKIWRRLCTDCMNSKLFNGVPNYPLTHQVNTLVAMTFRLDGSHEEFAYSEVGRVWPADGTAVAEEYERLKAADAEAGNGAAGQLDAFIATRKNILEATEARAEEAERWSDTIFSDSLALSEARLRRVLKSVRKRLLEEGHDPRDVDDAHELSQSPFLDFFPRLSSKHWKKARPYVLPLVDAARHARLAHERTLLIKTRSRVVVLAASHILRTAPRETWAYNPPAYAIEAFAPLRELIHDPSDTPLADDDQRLAEALVGLPAFVEEWRNDKRQLIASLLPSPSTSYAVEAPDVRRLQLATSVFTCLGSWVGPTAVTAGRSLIGWEGAGAHLRCRSLQRFWDRRPHFAPEGAAAARELVRLVGLDPETTTAAQMDRLCGNGKEGEEEKRFLCALCPTQGRKGIRGRPAMRWRECVQHTIECTRLNGGDVAHEAPAWVLLTEEGAADVRRREGPDPAARDNAWVCTLCTVHYEGRITLSAVVEHVRTAHTIQNPVEGQHFIYFVGAERTPRVPALLSQGHHVAEFLCNRCPWGKLWSMRQITRHVSDKHDVVVPSDGDWTRVERILRATPMPVAGG
ncbi:hypothetical protein C8R44DRAFT_875455 [Mycena epipterygia]|nr:hypothetical protein C8R44DRAFT_875455 [Mycena epipterygia]